MNPRVSQSLLAASAVLSLLAGAGVHSEPAQTLSGIDLFKTRCDGCHELPEPDDPKRPRMVWDQIVSRMIKVRGAVLNVPEKNTLLNYLDSFNREPRQIKWVDEPAKSRTAALPIGDVGKLPTEWVDVTLGADDPIPWAIQGDTKTSYLMPLKGAPESQFPALIDNTGIVQNGKAAVRVQLVSGKSAGAGVIFGYKSPQSYFGVRVSPQNVMLYEVQNGQRALRARAPMTVSVKQWHAVTVEIKDRTVITTLDGKPLPELTRTLEAYRGGRLGLHTQADTVAMFDQWAITVP